jgi:antitoxin component YwqK of YwqJK toxin-antitoxin module
MTLLHDAYVAWMSGLTHKTGNEIHWEDEDGNPITVEPIDVSECKYAVRYYYDNGQIGMEINYYQDQRHGKTIGWHKNGQVYWEADYYQDQRHGKSIGWWKSGKKKWEEDYYQDQQHGKCIVWHENGQKELEEEYEHGTLIRKIK